jgi:hypothetical protein
MDRPAARTAVKRPLGAAHTVRPYQGRNARSDLRGSAEPAKYASWMRGAMVLPSWWAS